MKIILCVVLTLALLSCGEKQNNNQNDRDGDMSTSDIKKISDAGSEDTGSEGACLNQNEAACDKDSKCLSVFGKPYDYTKQCLHPRIFAYCATQPVECNNGLEGLLYDPKTTNCWHQNSVCAPQGWLNFIDEDPTFPKKCLEAQEAAQCP